jgi:hypothetical protein
VIGNRRFGGEEEVATDAARRAKAHATEALLLVWRAVIESIDSVLDYDCRRASHNVRMRRLFSPEKPHISVLTSLAAGGDQIGASTAFEAAAAQTAVEVDLEAVLPFAEEDYPGLPGAIRPEFRHEEAEELRRLASEARQIVRLTGSYADPDGRRRSYEEARDLLLLNSDILIAIYDPRREGAAAGTAETVGLAFDCGMPVIAVLVTEENAQIAASHHSPHDDHDSQRAALWDDASPLGDPAWRSRVEEYIRGQLVLPELLSDDEEGGAAPKEGEPVTHALDRLAFMISGRAPWICRNEMLGKLFGAAWSALFGLSALAAPKVLSKYLKKLQDGDEPKIVLEPYKSFYDRASTMSGMFMRTYRGAFVLSYFLAGLAVAAAVAMMIVPDLMKKVPHPVMWTLCGIKIAILLLLLLLQKTAHGGRWHEAATDFRYLAELLRPMQWLTPIGTYPPAVELPLHATRHDPRRSWMAWLVRAVARTSPSVSTIEDGCGHHPKIVTLSPEATAEALDRARIEWIEGQVLYHSRTAVKMRILEEGLERIGQVLISVVLLAAIFACGIELGHEETVGARRVAVLFSALAAVFPAFIAAVAGVAFQSEAKRLAARYEAMHRALRHQQHLLYAAAARLRSGGSRRTTAPHAAKMLKDLSAITIAEAGEWKVLYQVHEIHAG